MYRRGSEGPYWEKSPTKKLEAYRALGNVSYVLACYGAELDSSEAMEGYVHG